MGTEKKQKLVIDGNAFYEIDLKCLEDKKKEQEEAKKQDQKGAEEITSAPFGRKEISSIHIRYFRNTAEEG